MSKKKTFTNLEQQVAALTAMLSDVRADRKELRAKISYLAKQYATLVVEAKEAREAARKAQNRASQLRTVNEDLKASRAHCRALEAELARVIRAAAARSTSEEDTTEE